MEVIIVLVVVAIVIALVVAGIHAKRKRREMFEGIARELGARFYEDDPFDLSDRFDSYFETLGNGSQRYAYNVIAGNRDGTEIKIFDHHYETYSHSKNGRQTHHHRRTFVLIRHDVDLGELDVRPEGMFDKLKAAFGYDDIDFESAEFSRKWHVRARDRKFAYDLFHPKMMEYFLMRAGFKMTTNGVWGLYRMGSGTMGGAEIGRTLSTIDGMMERFPRYLRKDRAQ